MLRPKNEKDFNCFYTSKHTLGAINTIIHFLSKNDHNLILFRTIGTNKNKKTIRVYSGCTQNLV